MPKVLLIGWDGADWRILDPLLERGDLPNLAALISRGGRALLKSTLPTHSWAAWPSFLTGVDPADHGVYDILESRGGTGRQFPVSFSSIRERTFLADLTGAGIQTLMVNVPLTFPPPKIEGKVIAGGVLPKRRTFTDPEGLARELEEAGVPWPINGTSWTTFRRRPEALLQEAMEFVRARQATVEYLLDTTDWEVACLVFVETDRIQHCLSQYISSDHPGHAERSKDSLAEKVRDVYRLLDEGLGRLVERAGPQDLILFMSDHGMRSCTGAVHMDRLLAGLGFLSFSASNAIFGPMQWGPVRAAARRIYDLFGLHGKVALPQSVDWSRTRAYTSIRSTGEGISVNLAGRESQGIVDPADFERVRDEVAERVGSFTDPRTGQRPVAQVWRREEVFKGRFADRAPDLLLDPAPLYSLTHARTAVEPADWLSGDHRMDGVFAAAGPTVDGQAFPAAFHLVDLAPTILAAAGAPPSVRHAGSVLAPVVGKAAGAAAEKAQGHSLGQGPDLGLTETEADEVEEHLRGLGYLE
jgi:predicted AlkP superfamily phosphohydrolase/phosphomutase